MASMLPVAVYGLKVPAGDVMIPAAKFNGIFRITMAAIDPTAEPKTTGTTNSKASPRATLKMLYEPTRPEIDDSDSDSDEEEDEDDEDELIKALLDGRESDGLSDEDDEEESDEDSSEDDEKNGGPSDPAKSKKARKEAAAEQLIAALSNGADEDESEDGMEVDDSPKVNGIIKKPKVVTGKGKAKTDDDEDIEDDEDENGVQEVVICTLDPEKTYQQPIDLTLSNDQQTYFKVSGTHAIYLSGNYVIPADNGHDHDYEDDGEGEYDLSPDEGDLEIDDDAESDELDNLEDPRITEVDTDDEKEAPQLVEKKTEKKVLTNGNKKRPSEDSEKDATEGASLDDIIAKSIKPETPQADTEPKLSKKQLKKLKNNAGKAVEAVVQRENISKDEAAQKGDKKVQFAKELEQGPASSVSTVKAETNGGPTATDKKGKENAKASLGVKTVKGLKIDDKKLGKGPAAKNGDRLGMRYIGKLSDGKVFDANKKGTPFRFKLGAGQVIPGWEIGLVGMSAQGERRIIIPAHLAYGSKSPPGIPPNSELTFDIKLLEVN